ncbi:hypothetical protein P0M11_12510 [Kaistella sp. PBT33-4]|uniref:hypothetical protein n=1 Tax=Kaistella sp. PBT33-4 TaxID=3032000 RepID=UPI0023D7D09F|nr:hypothetical protein [Kaistella sp. PBT33-4]MDF0720822.1 hypothetical protein [Kaistella sp. PBT33-4]
MMMEKSAHSNFAGLHDEVLINRLKQAARDGSLLAVYRVPHGIPGSERLLLITETEAATDALRAAKWVLKTGDQMPVSISSLHRAERFFEVGNPFVYCYYRPSFLVWCKEGFAGLFRNYAGGKPFKKKFTSFKECYYHDHDILLSEAGRFYSLNSPISTYLTYITIFEHDLRYLEQLYAGDFFPDESLHRRITNLIPYIPELQKLFVRQNGTNYYLINKLEDAIEAAHNDESYINTALYESIKKVERQLSHLVAARFKELKSAIGKQPGPTDVICAAPEEQPDDPQLITVRDILIKMAAPEEVFLFHKAETFQINAHVPTTVYYLFVIGQSVGNTNIQSIQQAVAARTQNKVSVIILAHRRITVQENLCFHQQFIQQIMSPANRIFSSSDMHPALHWEVSYEPTYGDLSLYHRGVKEHLEQYFNLRSHMRGDNSEGLFTLFSQGYLRLLRLIIYSSLCAYLPKWTSAWDTWQLCLFAVPSLKELEYLYGRIGRAFHKHIDSHLRYNDLVGRLRPDELTVMDEILTCLSDKLDSIIKVKKP